MSPYPACKLGSILLKVVGIKVKMGLIALTPGAPVQISFISHEQVVFHTSKTAWSEEKVGAGVADEDSNQSPFSQFGQIPVKRLEDAFRNRYFG